MRGTRVVIKNSRGVGKNPSEWEGCTGVILSESGKNARIKLDPNPLKNVSAKHPPLTFSESEYEVL